MGQETESNTRYYLKLLGGFMLFLQYGSFNTWGNVGIYMVSWIREKEPTLTMANAFSLIPIALIFMYAGVTFSVKAGEKFGRMAIILFGITIYPLGLFLASWCQDFTMFLITYGILPCTAIGLSWMIPFQICWELFPKSTGWVTGMITSGFNLSALFFNFFTSLLVNPNNEAPDIIVREGENEVKYYSMKIAGNVPYMMRLMALVLLFIGFLATFLLFIKATPPQKEEEESKTESLLNASQLDNTQNNNESVVSNTEQVQEKDSILTTTEKPKQPDFLTALKGNRFILYFLIQALTGVFTNFMVLYFKQLGLVKMNDDIFLSSVGSAIAFFSSVTRPGWGTILDKVGYYVMSLTLTVAEVILSGAIIFTLESKVWFTTCCILSGIVLSGFAVMIPTECANVYGKAIGSKVSAIIVVSNMFSLFILAGMSVFVQNVIGLSNLTLFYCGTSGIAYILNLYLIRTRY